jgi:uncharacterized protein (TIGR03905 family)
MTGDDYKIISDTTENGVRHITAIPSSLVCSQQIDFDIIDGKIHNLAYIRGCNGNLQAVGRLVEGMDIKKIVDTLSGVNCNFRGTSCTDQLARILTSL